MKREKTGLKKQNVKKGFEKKNMSMYAAWREFSDFFHSFGFHCLSLLKAGLPNLDKSKLF